jgi:hypothetical protein
LKDRGKNFETQRHRGTEDTEKRGGRKEREKMWEIS